MNQAEFSKISSLIESTESSEGKLKSFQKLIKQICATENAVWQQSTGSSREVIFQKRIPKLTTAINSDIMSAVEKTTKIKKSKQKKKKKSASIPTEVTIQKNFTHQLCGCCSGKLDNTLANDGYESDDEYYTNDSQIQAIIESIGEELLECFYDEIDKAIARIMKDAGSQHSRTFIKLVKKLGDIYDDFVQQLREQLQRELEEEAFSVLQTSWVVCQEFKNYIVTRFPLLKDFIENFKLAELNDKQNQDFLKLQCKNPLIQSIYLHMEKIAAKRSKKKIKRQQQKLNKQLSDLNQLQIQAVQPSFIEEQDIVERLKNLKIIEKQRSNCYFDYEKFNHFEHKFRRLSSFQNSRDR